MMLLVFFLFFFLAAFVHACNSYCQGCILWGSWTKWSRSTKQTSIISLCHVSVMSEWHKWQVTLAQSGIKFVHVKVTHAFLFPIGFRLERRRDKRDCRVCTGGSLQYIRQPFRVLEPSSLYLSLFLCNTKCSPLSFGALWPSLYGHCLFFFLIVFLMLHSMFFTWCSVQYVLLHWDLQHVNLSSNIRVEFSGI